MVQLVVVEGRSMSNRHLRFVDDRLQLPSVNLNVVPFCNRSFMLMTDVRVVTFDEADRDESMCPACMEWLRQH